MATFFEGYSHTFSEYLTSVADFVCGYPLFCLLIGGGLFLFISSGAVSLRRLPYSLAALRAKGDSSQGEISSAQALASVVAATIGLGNIAGVAIALVVGGPGAIFWMWVSALVGMCTKYHEGVLAIMYKGKDREGKLQGGPMYIIDEGMGRRWHWLAVFFAVAGMFGTLCIMNANQLTEAAVATFTTPEWIDGNAVLTAIGGVIGLSNLYTFRLLFGILVAVIVSVVVLGGVKRIAWMASRMVPTMVTLYFLLVLYIIVTHISRVPAAFGSIFTEAFNIDAGIGALVGIAIIGARRAALVNDAGIGTASLMHGASKNTEPPHRHSAATMRQHTHRRRRERPCRGDGRLPRGYSRRRLSADDSGDFLLAIVDVLLLLLRHQMRRLPLRRAPRTALHLLLHRHARGVCRGASAGCRRALRPILRLDGLPHDDCHPDPQRQGESRHTPIFRLPHPISCGAERRCDAISGLLSTLLI